MDKQELETKAKPIIDRLESGLVVNLLDDDELRLALAYKMWDDSQEFNVQLFEMLNPKDTFWTTDCVIAYLTGVFGYKGVTFYPSLGA